MYCTMLNHLLDTVEHWRVRFSQRSVFGGVPAVVSLELYLDITHLTRLRPFRMWKYPFDRRSRPWRPLEPGLADYGAL